MTLLIVETNVLGSLIIDSINEMIILAQEGQFTARQELNGVDVWVNGDSPPDLIFRDQQRAQRGYITGIVGPYPAVDLTAEELENDARIAADNERKREILQEEYNRRAEEKELTVKTKLANAPEIELADEESWVKTKEINGGGILSYAERWARLMQIELANGKNLQDIADDTSSEADTEGVTGFMYGVAVSILSKCWVQGETLRRWHNSKYQIGNEGDKANESGGVLNPAMLTIG